MFRPQIIVVGAGDVVLNRLLPALAADGLSDALVFAPEFPDGGRARLAALGAVAEILDGGAGQIVAAVRRHGIPAVVAAPSNRHDEYIRALAADGARFAVEKPLVVDSAQITSLIARPQLLEQAFCLSYYTLEKALTLTWFVEGRHEHSAAIEATLDGRPASGEDVARVRQKLGPALAVDAQLVEGDVPESRLWTLGGAAGGVVFDILIHAALAATKAAPGRLVVEQTTAFRSAAAVQRCVKAGLTPAATFVEVAGRAGIVPVRLRAAKLVSRPDETRTRFLRATFAGGGLHCCFETGALVVQAGGERLEARNRLIGRRYLSQVRLMRGFFAHGWRNGRTDECGGQLALLPVLCEIAARTADADVLADADIRAWHDRDGLPTNEAACRAA